MDMRDEAERLRDRVDELEAQIGAHQCTPIATVTLPGPSAQAHRIPRVPPPPVPPPGVPEITPPGYTPGPFAAAVARVNRPRPAMSAGPPAPAAPPSVFAPPASSWPTKAPPQQTSGQSTTLPSSSSRKRRIVAAEDYDESDEEAEELFMGKGYVPPIIVQGPGKAGRSNLANQVQAILGNCPVAGRGGRPILLTPQTSQEWDFARRALDDAHAAGHPQTGELLRALRRYITAANETAAKDRTKLSEVQRHALKQWRAPDWETISRWDHQSGTVVKTDTTKAQRREKRAADGNRPDSLLQELSDRLGLSIDGRPHPNLGDIASPRHADHPDLWGVYARHMTKVPPRGFAFGPGGFPFQRHVRAFCRFAPLFRGSTGYTNNHHGQIRTMAIISRLAYGDGLRALGITPSATPDWSPIEFEANPSDNTIIAELARRGITENEALDASDFAFSWLTDTLVHEDDENIRAFIISALSARATAAPWPEIMQFTFNEAYRRWMPVVPAAAVAAQPVAPGQSAADLSPSSARGGAPSQETPLPPAPSSSLDDDVVFDLDPESGNKPSDMEIDGQDKTAKGSS